MVEIKKRGEEMIHRGMRFSLVRVTEELPDEKIAVREIVRHPGAAVVLPVLADGRVVLVEQHRTAVGGPLLEVPAGTLDPGEAPLEAARRELEEETGYRARSWRHLISFYPSPGITDEQMHVYLATELAPGPQNLDANEIVELRLLPFEEFERRVLAGEIRDGKTALALLLYSRLRGAP